MTTTQANPFTSIFAVDPATVLRRGAIRHEPRKVIAAQLRALFRLHRIKGVSVTAPNYSMAQSVDVRIPETPEHDRSEANGHEYRDCPICQSRNRASDHLERIILAAYPDLNDRSDFHSDHFDYRFSIH